MIDLRTENGINKEIQHNKSMLDYHFENVVSEGFYSDETIESIRSHEQGIVILNEMKEKLKKRNST